MPLELPGVKLSGGSEKAVAGVFILLAGISVITLGIIYYKLNEAENKIEQALDDLAFWN